MATHTNPALTTLGRKRRLFSVLALFFVYRLCRHASVPWIDCNKVEEIFGQYGRHSSTTILGIDPTRCSALMLGISPYLTATLLLGLASLFFPGLERLHKGGEIGTLKLTRWTVALSLGLATFWSFTLMWAMGQNGLLLSEAGTGGICIAALTIVAGYSVILVLISQLGRFGLGAGVGLIVLANAVAQLPRALVNIFELSHVIIPEGTSASWVIFQILVAPAIVLVAIAATCVALEGLFRRDGTAIMCIAMAGSVIASGGVPGIPLPSKEEPEVIRLTRKALSAQQPLHYVFLFVLIVALWMLLQSGIFRKKSERLRSNALELIAGIALATLVTASDMVLSGLDLSQMRPSWAALVPPMVQTGYDPSGPGGASFVISVFACAEINKVYKLSIPRVGAVLGRLRRERVQVATETS